MCLGQLTIYSFKRSLDLNGCRFGEDHALNYLLDHNHSVQNYFQNNFITQLKFFTCQVMVTTTIQVMHFYFLKQHLFA